MGRPRRANVNLTVDNSDLDHPISTAVYSEGLTKKTVTMHLLIWQAGTWVSVLSIPWVCEAASGDLRSVTLKLSGGVGILPKAGLVRGTRSCPNVFSDGVTCLYAGATYSTCAHTWDDCVLRAQTARFRGLRWAPTPGQQIRLGSAGGVTLPGHSWSGGELPPPNSAASSSNITSPVVASGFGTTPPSATIMPLTYTDIVNVQRFIDRAEST